MSSASGASYLLEPGPAIDLADPVTEIADRAAQSPVLRAFGAPASEVAGPAGAKAAALLALHLAAAYHRLAVVCDVAEDYRRRARVPAGEPAYLAALRACAAEREPRRIAQTLYRRALEIDPDLAEAHFGLGRVAMALGEAAAALKHFARTVDLPPHPAAPAHAQLHASAYWHRAALLEDRGDDQAALESYREALSRLGSFGVHHVRVAHFLRRLGLVEEAAKHYRRCMEYTHFYFAEFMLPPLAPGEGPAAAAIPEPLYTTSRGEVVVHWQGAYLAVPGLSWPAWRRRARTGGGRPGAAQWVREGLGRLFGRDGSAGRVKRADSIAAFEDPAEPEVGASGDA